MGNCSVATLIEGNIRVPQPEDETVFQTDIRTVSKNQMKSFIIPFDTYSLIEYTNMAPTFMQVSIMYKKQKYDSISKTIKQVRGVTFQDECFNVKNTINSIISYLDETIEDIKMVTKFDLNSLNCLKIDTITKVYLDASKNQTEKDLYLIMDDVWNNKNASAFETYSSEVKMGTFGNPNLINTLVYLVFRDKFWIKNLLYKFDQETKIFIVKLYIQGLPKHILLDEFIPVNSKNEPGFLNPPLYLFWVVLVEKAIAKVNRSYANSLRCFASELFPLLSEVPIIRVQHNLHSEKGLWKALKESTGRNYISFCERENKKNDVFSALNYISFFISSIFKVNNNKYIELIIPNCEEKESIENFKKSIRLEEEDLKNTKFFPEAKVASNQIIYMKFQQYYNYFFNTFIYKEENQYIYTTKKVIIYTNQYTMLRLNPLQKTKAIITVHLKEGRYSSQEFNYSLCQVVLVKLKIDETFINRSENQKNKSNTDEQNSFYEEENEYLFEYIASSFDTSYKVSVDANLDPNETYFLLIKAFSETNVETNCVVSLYSSTYIEVGGGEENANANFLDNVFFQPQNLTILTQSLKSLFISYLNSNSEDISTENGIRCLKSKDDLKFGFSIFKFENTSETNSVQINLTYNLTEMNLITLKSGQKQSESQSSVAENQNEYNLLLSPGSGALVVFEWTKMIKEHDFKFKMSLQKGMMGGLNRFITQVKTKINDDLYDQEVPYGKGVFVIIVNKSSIEYILRAVFDSMDNLELDVAENENPNEFEMLLKPQSKNFINLLVKDPSQRISYQITYLAKPSSPEMN